MKKKQIKITALIVYVDNMVVTRILEVSLSDAAKDLLCERPRFDKYDLLFEKLKLINLILNSEVLQ